MLGLLVRRVVSLFLLAIVAVGGGRLPTIDALVFHDSVEGSGSLGSHFEAGSGCHEDGCSVRSVAHESRLPPLLATPALDIAPPEDTVVRPVALSAPRAPLPS